MTNFEFSSIEVSGKDICLVTFAENLDSIPDFAFKDHPVLVQELKYGQAKNLEGLKTMKGGVYARNESWLPSRSSSSANCINARRLSLLCSSIVA